MTSLWTSQFQKDKSYIGEVIEKLPEMVTAGLKLELKNEANTQLARRDTTNMEAEFEFYQGLATLLKHPPDRKDFSTAQHHFERAIELDPNFSEAYCALAATLLDKLDLGISVDRVLLDQAEGYLKRALQIDEANSRAYSTLSNVYRRKRQLYDACIAIGHSLALDPNNERNLEWLAIFYRDTGMWDECLKILEQIRKFNPNYSGEKSLAMILAWQGRYEEAEQVMTPFLSMYGFDRMFLAIMKIEQKDYQRAAELRSSIKDKMMYTIVNLLLESAMHPNAPLGIPKDLLKFGENDPMVAYFLACKFALSKQPVKAVDWLRTAEDMGWLNPYLLRKQSFFDPIRDTPEFQAYLSKLESHRNAFLSSLPPIESISR